MESGLPHCARLGLALMATFESRPFRLKMAAKRDCDHLCVSGGTALANRMKYTHSATMPIRKRYTAAK